MFSLLILCIAPLTAYAQHHSLRLQPWHWLTAPFFAICAAAIASFCGPWSLALPVTLSCVVGQFSSKYAPFLWFLIACFLCTSGNFLLRYHQHIHHANLLSKKPQTIHAIVSDSAPWQSKKRGTIVTLEVSHIGYQSAPCRIRCYLYTECRLHVGSQICAYGVQLKPTNTQDHFFMYAFRDGIVGSFFAPFLRSRTVTSCAPEYHWYRRWHAYRDTLYQRCKTALPTQTFLYFSALFLGNKNLPDYATTRRKFAIWGITHYLARSGLHIALLVMLLGMILTLLPAPFFIRKIILLFLLIFYSALSWSSISFLRALLLWIFYLGGAFLQRIANPLHLFSIVTLALVLHNPANVFCLDFQLSFFLSGVLMMINHTKKREFLLASCTT